MDRSERFDRIDRLLSERRIVPLTLLMHTLGVSRATVKRDLEYMRNRLNAPIVWDRTAGGYRFAGGEGGAAQYELPGLGFSAEEMHALLLMQHLLMNLDRGGLLGPHVEALRSRLRALLGTARDSAEEIRKRIRILGVGARPRSLEHFAVVGAALLRRKRLLIAHDGQGCEESVEGEVSPQRLVYYRDNWFLDAWYHPSNDLRSFAVDAIRHAELIERPARNVPERTLDAVLGAGYGLFTARRVQRARLRFTPQRARWAARQQWHPKQKGRFEPDGSYVLEIPYSDSRPLVMDILRHGAEVEVLAPAALREEVVAALRAALDRY